MKKKYIDVHDSKIDAIIYTLLFSGIYCEIRGNDLIYEIYPWDDLDEEGNPIFSEYSEEAWKERLARGSSNCCSDEEGMKKLVANPITEIEAKKHFLDWLKENGYTAEEGSILVKIWW